MWSVTPKIYRLAWYMLDMQKYNQLNIYCMPAAYEICGNKVHKVGGALRLLAYLDERMKTLD